APQHLTEFYFWMAFGGVLGGVFVAVAAPFIFQTVIEYPLLVAAVAFFRQPGDSRKKINGGDLIFPALLGFLGIGGSKLLKAACVDITTDFWTSISVDAVIILIAYLLRHRVLRFALAMAILVFAYHRLLPEFFGGEQFIYSARDFFGVKGVKYDPDTNS